MKKLLLSIGLLFAITLSASAQFGPNAHNVPIYRHFNNTGELRLHVAGELGFADIGGIFIHEMPYHYSVGGMIEYQTARRFSIGLGTEFYGFRHIDYTEISNGRFLNCVPVYANARVNSTGRTRFFAEAKLGYAIPTNRVYLNNIQGNVAAQGFYTGAAIGLMFSGNNISVGFNSLDICNVDTHEPVYYSNNRKMIATDFYIRYSYAFPLN